jgi:hypothetical protein
MANGRCRLHGGKTPSGPDSANFRHGRYASAFKNQLAAKFDRASADTAPLDLLPELATQRAVLEQYLEIINAKTKLTAGALANVNALTTDVVNTAVKIAKMRNDEALTANEIRFFQAAVLRLLEKYVPDTNTRRNFIRELTGIIPQRIDARRDEPASLPAGAGEASQVT